jgi:hypothetical protein
MAKAQQRAIKMETCEVKIVTKRRRVILEKATLLEKGIKIPNLERFMWT